MSVSLGAIFVCQRVSLGAIFVCQRGKIDSLLLISVSFGRLVKKVLLGM